MSSAKRLRGSAAQAATSKKQPLTTPCNTWSRNPTLFGVKVL